MTPEHQKLVVQEIARNQSRLRGFVRCLLLRSDEVDDLVQDISVTLWEKAADFKQGTDFWAWASQIARFKAFNQLRRAARERLVFDDETLARLATIAEQKLTQHDARRDALSQCLQSLPSAQRQLLDLRYASGQTIERIAESIGRPAQSIRQTLYRLRSALLECVERRMRLEESPA